MFDKYLRDAASIAHQNNNLAFADSPQDCQELPHPHDTPDAPSAFGLWNMLTGPFVDAAERPRALAHRGTGKTGKPSATAGVQTRR